MESEKAVSKEHISFHSALNLIKQHLQEEENLGIRWKNGCLLKQSIGEGQAMVNRYSLFAFSKSDHYILIVTLAIVNYLMQSIFKLVSPYI